MSPPTSRDLHRLLRKPPEIRTQEDVRAISEGVRGVSFFEQLDAGVRQSCCGALRHQFVEGGHTIFKEGDAGSLFYVVLNGAVGVYVRDLSLDEVPDPEEAQRAAAAEAQRQKREEERQRRLQQQRMSRLSHRVSVSAGMGLVNATRARMQGTLCALQEEASDPSEDTDGEREEDAEDAPGGPAAAAGAPRSEARPARRATGTHWRLAAFRVRAVARLRSGLSPLPAGLKQVATFRGGDAFGQVALQMDSPRTATVRTLAATHFAVLRREDYQNILAGAFESERCERFQFLSAAATSPQPNFFSSWSVPYLTRICSVMHRRELRKGQVLFDIGSSTVQVYFAHGGEFSLCRPVEAVEPPVGPEAAQPPSKGRGLPCGRDDGNGHHCEDGAAPGPAGTSAEALHGWRLGRRRLWCTVGLVAPPHALGLSANLAGSRTHSERAVCLSVMGCVYGVLAKELVGCLDARARALAVQGASAQQASLDSRARSLARLARASAAPAAAAAQAAAAGRPGPDWAGAYSSEGRLALLAGGCPQPLRPPDRRRGHQAAAAAASAGPLAGPPGRPAPDAAVCPGCPLGELLRLPAAPVVRCRRRPPPRGPQRGGWQVSRWCQCCDGPTSGAAAADAVPPGAVADLAAGAPLVLPALPDAVGECREPPGAAPRVAALWAVAPHAASEHGSVAFAASAPEARPPPLVAAPRHPAAASAPASSQERATWDTDGPAATDSAACALWALPVLVKEAPPPPGPAPGGGAGPGPLPRLLGSAPCGQGRGKEAAPAPPVPAACPAAAGPVAAGPAAAALLEALLGAARPAGAAQRPEARARLAAAGLFGVRAAEGPAGGRRQAGGAAAA